MELFGFSSYLNLEVILEKILSSAFEQIMEFHRAGNPMNAGVRFTYLCVREIVEKLRVLGQLASPCIVTLLLSLQRFGKRKMQKKGTACTVEGRNEQFEYIAQLAREFKLHGQPVVSMDNPIDHRLFPHVTRALQGILLDSVDTVAKLINERASTQTGLKVFAHIVDKTFVAGKKVASDFKTNISSVRLRN